MKMRICLAAVAVLALAGLCRAQERSPKDVAIAFTAALAAGDAQQAGNLATGTDKELAFIDAYTAMTKSLKRFADAAVAKFGDNDSTRGIKELNLPAQRLGRLEAAEQKIDGDKATLTLPDNREPVLLKKVDGAWKMDLSTMNARGDMLTALNMFAGMSKAADETAAEIAAGKYHTADEAKEAFGMKYGAVLMTSASTQPTSQP